MRLEPTGGIHGCVAWTMVLESDVRDALHTRVLDGLAYGLAMRPLKLFCVPMMYLNFLSQFLAWKL